MSVLGPSRRTVRMLDAVAVASLALFVLLGVLVGIQLGRLSALGVALDDAATALDQAGSALQGVARVPLVGGQVTGLADSVVATAASVRAGGQEAVTAVRALAVLGGIAVALLPLPVLLAYLPFRIGRARALRELQRELAEPDPGLVAQLAHRAAVGIHYPRLRAVSTDPWGDLAAGRHEALAAAELTRLGITLTSASGSRA